VFSFPSLIIRARLFNLPGQSAEGVQFELPANGNLRVENPRGSVFVEVWNQTYLSVAAVSDNGESIPSPAVIHSTASLVSVRVPAGAARASQVNLRLRIPARTHAAILTTNGAVEVKACRRRFWCRQSQVKRAWKFRQLPTPASSRNQRLARSFPL
jgi:hypothetical protein